MHYNKMNKLLYHYGVQVNNVYKNILMNYSKNLEDDDILDLGDEMLSGSKLMLEHNITIDYQKDKNGAQMLHPGLQNDPPGPPK